MSQTDFSGVSFQAELPLGWETTALPAENVLQEWMHTNVALLHALATMEGQAPEYEKESAGEVDRRLDRIEAKLELMLNLLSRVLARSASKPGACPVTLSASRIEWIDGGHAPAAGQDVVISLFINPRLPQPLLLPARVRAVSSAAAGTLVRAEFSHLSEEAQEWLERTVFRHHRRFIQSRRREES